MAERPAQERRTAVRVDCQGDSFWRIALRVPVRLLDLGEGGALMAPSRSVPLSGSGRLRIRLSGMPIEAEVKVVRQVEGKTRHEGTHYEVAAVFVAMDERSRGVMTEFIRSRGGMRAT